MRNPIYTTELASALCDEIATTTKGLKAICSMPGMPALTTVVRWLRSNDEFKQLYAQAKVMQQELEIEDLKDISDGSTDDDMIKVNRDKLKIHARMWLASKLAPKKYGDKLDVNHGGQADNPIITGITFNK